MVFVLFYLTLYNRLQTFSLIIYFDFLMVPDLAGGNPSGWLLSFTDFSLLSCGSVHITYLISHLLSLFFFVGVVFKNLSLKILFFIIKFYIEQSSISMYGHQLTQYQQLNLVFYINLQFLFSP